MFFRACADVVVVVHFAFAIFAVLGGVLVLKRKRWAWLHVPAMLWAALIEFADWMCPLTWLEDWLLERGGGTPYAGDFVEHYLLPILYPDKLTRSLQITLGLLVVVVNVVIYAWLIRQRLKTRHY
ncbi:MAG: DUF2784 domain-containing protein [Acidobacteriia bacterium]|nr:DUF2784 domain-containing protein [Terriglobia bacterium]